MNRPQPLGLKRSFGYGDRLGVATPGHVAAAKAYRFASIFAQQSIREMTRTDRTPTEVMQAAQAAVDQLGFSQPWGADADHLKTPEDVQITAEAGFCFFTIDPSEYVDNGADGMTQAELELRVDRLESEGVFALKDWKSFYLSQAFDLGVATLTFDPETLSRAAVKYARAIDHTAKMARAIAAAMGDRPYEMEVSVDETETPTTPLEHLFYGMELKRRSVSVISLAPRFVGDFEKGIDFRGDQAAFEASLKLHVAVARYCGPYKISVHSGSDKFSVYPAIGRECGELLHVKTAGTSYLEALRVVARQQPTLFSEIAAYSRGRFAEDLKSYHISTSQSEIEALPRFENAAAHEGVYLDERVGRQLLHVTFGSVLTLGKTEKGRLFRAALMEVLQAHPDLHEELLEGHFSKHLSLLNQG